MCDVDLHVVVVYVAYRFHSLAYSNCIFVFFSVFVIVHELSCNERIID